MPVLKKIMENWKGTKIYKIWRRLLQFFSLPIKS
jgi:hypothetical protein